MGEDPPQHLDYEGGVIGAESVTYRSPCKGERVVAEGNGHRRKSQLPAGIELGGMGYEGQATPLRKIHERDRLALPACI